MEQSANLMQGKICMITGATSGIGQATARSLAQMGATVIVVGRSHEKSATTVDQIKQQTGNPGVEFILADLSSQKEIRRLVQQFNSHYQRLHVLVNNAAALYPSRRESVDGIEMTFALNHLGYFLLTNLLLDTLKASAPARIINVSAVVHKRARLNFDDLQNQRRYGPWQAYSESKLANVLFTYELARYLEGSGVTVNALQPETVAITRLLKRLANVFPSIIKSDQGTQTILYLATSMEVEGVTGKYFVNKKETPSSPASYDRGGATLLWQMSESMTK